MGIRFNSSADDQETVSSILGAPGPLKVMVCPGSRWPNKQLPSEAMASFLVQIQENFGADYYLMWGDLNEKQYCLELQQKVSGIVVDRLSVPAWQNLMSEMDLVIAVDSAALHLCGTTGTPSFSLFGPTSPSIFKPLGAMHLAVQGDCPYNKSFEKACPLLRTCSTGACIRNLTPDWIFGRFSSWWTSKIIARR
jgi:heptosyltransferase-1